jgi:hypothetical protein
VLILRCLERLPVPVPLYYVGGDVHSEEVLDEGLVAPSEAGKVVGETGAFRGGVDNVRDLGGRVSILACPMF